ncbi:hypothetical protein ACC699_39965, partial [Rhizobium ruizarguesonis]
GEVKGPETVLDAMTPENPAAADAPLATAVAIVFDDKLVLFPDALSMLAGHRIKPSIEDLDGMAPLVASLTQPLMCSTDF